MYLVLQRYLVLSLLSLLLILGGMQAAKYFSRPDLYPGDRVEERACRWCGGSGKDKEMARRLPELGDACHACGGDGKVDVIIPGAERPTKIAGVVIDSEWDNGLASPDSFRPKAR